MNSQNIHIALNAITIFLGAITTSNLFPADIMGPLTIVSGALSLTMRYIDSQLGTKPTTPTGGPPSV